MDRSPFRARFHVVPLLRAASSALLVSVVSSGVAAQSAADRVALHALADSLPSLPAAPLAALAAQTPRDRALNSGIARLRLGLIQLRMGALEAGRSGLDEADATLTEAAFRAPDDWPWPWYALSDAKLALAERRAVAKASMYQPEGENYRNAALKALSRALVADSAFAPAAARLAEVLLPRGERELSADLQRAVRRAARAGAGPGPALALGRMYRNLEEPDSALAAFRVFVATGGDSGVGLLEVARALSALRREGEAVETYLAGANAARAVGARAYRQDVAWVAAPDELASFDSLPTDSVGAWIARFWRTRDAEELRRPGERLAEHLRRWNRVYTVFRLPPMPESRTARLNSLFSDGRDYSAEATGIEATDAQLAVENLYAASLIPATHIAQHVVDSRALIYMRHGEPHDTVISIARVGIPGGLTWMYNTTTGPLVFHFICSAFCELGRMPPSFDGLLEIDARYERLAMSVRNGRPDVLLAANIARDRRADLATGLRSDGFPPRFLRELRPLIQVFAVGDAAAGTARALVVFAIPSENLMPTARVGDRLGYGIAMRIIAANARGDERRLDTTRVFAAPDTLRPGTHLFGMAELRLGAGTWDLRALFTQPGTDRGGAAARIGLRLPSSQTLTLSDLVLGRQGSGLVWRAADGTVPLNPLDAYRRDTPVELYYEARGLVPGARYRTTLTITDAGSGARGRVSLGFDETAASASQSFRRTIGLDQLRGGQYLLTVTVARVGGTTPAESRRYVNVIAEGARPRRPPRPVDVRFD